MIHNTKEVTNGRVAKTPQDVLCSSIKDYSNKIVLKCIHSFIFSNCFLLFRVTHESVPGNTGCTLRTEPGSFIKSNSLYKAIIFVGPQSLNLENVLYKVQLIAFTDLSCQGILAETFERSVSILLNTVFRG